MDLSSSPKTRIKVEMEVGTRGRGSSRVAPCDEAMGSPRNARGGWRAEYMTPTLVQSTGLAKRVLGRRHEVARERVAETMAGVGRRRGRLPR
jgi:hypothetical protein